ncbi:Exopolyphosphatase [Sinobacterium norvegicum]|uniref:Exopolyphosphatase n=1 Tax=Sinobacterium norvegicum TaxID=1641715 RepID=A0ABM9AF87_9GAMM|nr:hypothetical protein [Sinobacterium norvegicum]CAH0991867.1 Exopolyphosphatase [Sinobacterium norvegicum]
MPNYFMQTSQTIASLDLGSNSFHLLIADIEHNSFRPVYSNGWRTQLGLSLDSERLTAAAIERGLKCLKELRLILDKYHVTTVMAVGTAALRNAKNSEDFICPAEVILGSSIKIISGIDEAQLIYSGVTHLMPVDDRLVIDIGGASTELIQRQQGRPPQPYSLAIGCLSHCQEFYRQPDIDVGKFDRSIVAARTKIKRVKPLFTTRQQAVVGCSGVIDAVQNVLANNHWGTIITFDGLKQARQHATANFQHIDDVNYKGLKEDRRHLYLSGLAIIIALFEELEIASIEHVSAALKEGIIARFIEQQSAGRSE